MSYGLTSTSHAKQRSLVTRTMQILCKSCYTVSGRAKMLQTISMKKPILKGQGRQKWRNNEQRRRERKINKPTLRTPLRILPPATPPSRSSTSQPGLLTSNDLITANKNKWPDNHRIYYTHIINLMRQNILALINGKQMETMHQLSNQL